MAPAQKPTPAGALTAEQVQALIDRCDHAATVAQQAGHSPLAQAYATVAQWLKDAAGGPQQPAQKAAGLDQMMDRIRKISTGGRFS